VGVPGRIVGLVSSATATHDGEPHPTLLEDRPVPHLSLARRHDPYWDMDGKGARIQRVKQRLIRLAVWVVVVAVLAFAATRLPAIDPEFLFRGAGRPILGGALLTILGSATLLALARLRQVNRS
jgi:hypothetical protein